jgi:hypothetical protein
MNARLKQIEQQLVQILNDIEKPTFRVAVGDSVCRFLKAAAWGAALASSIRVIVGESANGNPDGCWEADEVRKARALLGVSVGASPDQIRRALKIKLRDGRLHPDHGGDGVVATELIAAKNLLIQVAFASSGTS